MRVEEKMDGILKNLRGQSSNLQNTTGTNMLEVNRSFGPGKDTWYLKAERWARKQNWFVQGVSLGFILYLKKWWFNVKIENTMRDVDRQAKDIVQQWEDEERRQYAPELVETGVFGDEGWSISISNPAFEGWSQVLESELVTPSDVSAVEEDEGDPTRS